MKKIISILSMFIAIAIATVSCSSNDDNEITEPTLSTLASINDFSIAIENVSTTDITYDLGTNITVSVPFGTSLTAVVPTIELAENATVSPASGESITFVDGEPKTFTVTAEDGETTKEYTVTVNVKAEVGSGSKLKTYVLADLYGENSTTTYTYNEANFVSSFSKEEDVWGDISTTVYTLVYNDKNQVIEKTTENGSTIYEYNDAGQIVKGIYKYEDVLTYTYVYNYDAVSGNLIRVERTNHTGDEDEIDDIKTYKYDENNNVIELITGTAQSNVFTASYDDKNNPFKGMYPAAYAAINVGIEEVNTNNPISGTLADDTVTYVYNTDGYPLTAAYTYFDGFATVNKTFTYYAAE